MSSTALFRIVMRTVRPSTLYKTSNLAQSTRPIFMGTLTPIAPSFGSASNFSTASRRLTTGHEEETYEEFSARYEKEFDSVQDVFELQRNLNNVFAYDLVPSVEVLAAALRAARRVDDFPTAVRVFEGIKAKVENDGQYRQYLEKLDDLRKDLGVALREELYPSSG